MDHVAEIWIRTVRDLKRETVERIPFGPRGNRLLTQHQRGRSAGASLADEGVARSPTGEAYGHTNRPML